MSPTNEHEALVDFFRDEPGQLLEVLGDNELFPMQKDWIGTACRSDFNSASPDERRADAVVTYRAPGDTKDRVAVIVEVQRAIKKDKVVSWARYLASARARHDCPVMLAVVCTDERTAKWAEGPLKTGCHDWEMRPFVISPGTTVAVTDIEAALADPLAVIKAALIHQRKARDRAELYRAVAVALWRLPVEEAQKYTDAIYMSAPESAKSELREAIQMIKTNPRFQPSLVAEFKAEGKAEGRAEGKAESVLAVLAARGFEVPEDLRDRVGGCDDADRLDVWLRRAATLSELDAVFADGDE